MSDENRGDEASGDTQVDFSADDSNVDSGIGNHYDSTAGKGHEGTKDRQDDEASEDDWSDFSGGDLELEIDDVDDGDTAAQDSPSSVPSWQCPPPALLHVASNGTQGDPNWQVYRSLPIMNAAAGAEESGPQIRLLKILAGSGEQPIHCALVRRHLYDTPDYQALSYSWGHYWQYDRSVYIQLSNVEILVSAHLWKAIQRLRNATREVFVWVDAICIDQHNVIERAAQVGIMAQIYDQARQVVIWLGDIDEVLQDPDKDDADVFTELCFQPSPWWTRLWVLQECAYARECPLVLFGSASMTLKKFVDWSNVAAEELHLKKTPRQNLGLVHLKKTLRQTLDLIQTPYDIWQAQKGRNEHRRPLLSRLRETRDRECSNGYDRVFALRSLVLEHEEEQLGSDYRESVINFIPKVRRIIQEHPDWRGREDESLLYALHPLAEALFASDTSATRRYHALKDLSLRGDHVAAKALLESMSQLSSAPWPMQVLRVAVRHHWSDVTEHLSRPSEVYGDPSKIYLGMLQSAAREDRQDKLLELLELTGAFPFRDDPVLSTMLSAARNGSVHHQRLFGFAGIISSPDSSSEDYDKLLQYAFSDPGNDHLYASIIPRLVKIVRSSGKGICKGFSFVHEAARSKQAAFLKLFLEEMPLPSRGCYQNIIIEDLWSTDEECLKILLAASAQRQAEDKCPRHPWPLGVDPSKVVIAHDHRLVSAVTDLIKKADSSRDPMIHLLVQEAPDLAINEQILRSAVVEGRFDLLMHMRGLTDPYFSQASGAPGCHSASESLSLSHDVENDQLMKILAEGNVLGEAIVRAATHGRTADIRLLLPNCRRIQPDVDLLDDALVAACEGNHVEIIYLLAPHLGLAIISDCGERLLYGGPPPNDSLLIHRSFRAACWRGAADAAFLILAYAANPQAVKEALPQDVFVEVFRQGHDRVAELLVQGGLFRPDHGNMLVQALVAACATYSEAHTRTVHHLVSFGIYDATRCIKEIAATNEAENDRSLYAGYYQDLQLLLQQHPLDCALFAACMANHPGLVKPRLDIAPRLLNGMGLHKCALLVLSYRGQIDLVRHMMMRFGTTALGLDRVNNAASIARSSGHENVAQLLSAYGAEDGYVIEEFLMRLVRSSCDMQGLVIAYEDSQQSESSQVLEEVEVLSWRRERILVEDLLVISCFNNVGDVDGVLAQLVICKDAPLVEEDLRAAFAAAALGRREAVIDRLKQQLADT